MSYCKPRKFPGSGGAMTRATNCTLLRMRVDFRHSWHRFPTYNARVFLRRNIGFPGSGGRRIWC